MKNTIRQFFHQSLLLITLMTVFSLLFVSAQSIQEQTCLDSVWTYSSGTSTNSSHLQSYWGGVHTPKDDLHLLVIFVGYNDLDSTWVPNPGWLTWPSNPSILPEFARGDTNDLFNTDPSTISYPNSKQNLSEFYYTVSGGEFRVTADIYSEQVIVDYDTRDSGYSVMNKAALTWIANNDTAFDWSKYDNRENWPNFEQDNSTSVSDGVLDYVVFIHRANGNSGIATPIHQIGPNFDIPGTSYSVQARGGHTSIFSTPIIKDRWKFFQHEFAHNLYSAVHYFGANGVVAHYYYTQFGWGMMSNTNPQFFVPNAWERWWMDWIDTVTTVTINSADSIFTLSDHMQTGDAIRILIPNSDSQFVWLENHQKIHDWDKKYFFNDFTDGDPDLGTGIYGYIPSQSYRSRSNPKTGFRSNAIKILNAEGNWDMKPTSRLLTIGSKDVTVYSRIDRIANPISGNNATQGVPFDGINTNTADGIISLNTAGDNGGDTERGAIRAEEIQTAGNDVKTEAFTGDLNDAFTVGDKIGLSGILPISTYQRYDDIAEKIDPTILSGISIEILSENSGTYTLKIKFDDFALSQDTTRWCGNIELPNISGEELLLKADNTLLIDLGQTPDRVHLDSVTNTFTNPSEYIMKAGSKMRLDSQSVMKVQNHSIFRMEAGSVLEIETGAELRIDSTASFIMEPGSIVEVRGNGEILIQRGAYYFFGQSASLSLLGNNSCISIKGDWELGEDAVFTFTGDGFVYLGLPTPYANNGNVKRTPAVNDHDAIVLVGNGPTDKVLQIESNTILHPQSGLDTFRINNGLVELGDDASIFLEEAQSISLKDITVKAANTQDQHKGIFIQKLLASFTTIDNVTIEDGLHWIAFWPGPIPNTSPLRISNSSFSNNGHGVRTFGNSAELDNVTMDGNDIGWRAWAATSIGLMVDGTADNGSNGIHYEGGLGELRFLESQANNNEVGILVDGDVTFFTNCAEVKDNSLKGLSMYNGSILDLSSYPVNDDPAQLDASNNENTITLNQAANLRLSGGNNDLRPASPGYGDVVYGSLTVNCSTTIDGLGNAWNASGSAPVQGQGVNDNYYVTGLGGSCLITISDPSPEDPATCGDSDIDGGELVDPLFDCSECESVTIYINPAIDGPDGNGSPQTLPLNESLQSAMEEMRRYDDLNGDDIEATWRMLQLLEHSYTSISTEEAYLLDLAYESMKRAFSSAIAHDEVELGDGNSEPNNNLDDLSTAITDYLDIEIQASPAYQAGLRYHTDQAIIYQALGYRDEALGYFDDAKDWASSSDDPPIDTWICLLNHEQDLVDGQITI